MTELSLHILDIVQNSLTAGADRICVRIAENPLADRYEIRIGDNGRGMDEATAKKATDPFFTSRTTRRVGLGISLLKQNAELTGGRLSLYSKPGKGTIINARFSHSHIDRQPLGDIAGTICLILEANPGIELSYEHRTEIETYIFDSAETKTVLEVSDFTHEILGMVKVLIHTNLEDIRVAF